MDDYTLTQLLERFYDDMEETDPKYQWEARDQYQTWRLEIDNFVYTVFFRRNIITISHRNRHMDFDSKFNLTDANFGMQLLTRLNENYELNTTLRKDNLLSVVKASLDSYDEES